jgi:hypothetical protein
MSEPFNFFHYIGIGLLKARVLPDFVTNLNIKNFLISKFNSYYD